ncbi:coenzyme F420-reducing hydrogenase subunit alpha-like protein [Mesorhizobium amorphae CCNWGS0123]|uniref:Coenzyme F420-reducing hydrogenase subunit alpha-like protein n=1 Tax=Mesorhizobium amorphae CCNWGS0123 TaxID=1082933 RepID=G6YIW8_9HYPH|nr:hydrogenase assembly protein HupF [Mesorhizobium amorphae CCNWGS0123]EHH05808.1 coenzyme F420-reducing hydrogenase subunit alpha-like protein [Mesorhizobium amorphae CCNWGS0123]
MTFGAGSIRIDVTVSRALACCVEIKSNRPQGLARLFVGRRPEEAPVLAGQVFSLCGVAQSVAARLAVLNAADLPMRGEERFAATAKLLAERIFETLRALILHWPLPLPAAIVALAGKYLREALAASQAIIAGAKAKIAKCAFVAEPAARLSAAAAALGIPDGEGQPPRDTAYAAILGNIDRDRIFVSRRPNPLTVADDAEVIAHLSREAGYASLPYLAGRVVETGAYARLSSAGMPEGPHLAERFLARINDVRLCLQQLSNLDQQDTDACSSLMGGGPTPGAGGYGAVECARGRLYHLAEIGMDGHLCAYRILAPTEWNFHPAGPFVETLLSSRIGVGESAARSVSRLATLFDPCVAFEIGVREAAYA